MAKDPAFLFYSGDFILGTAEFTNEEVGQYIRALCYLHQKGRMTEKTMCFLVGSFYPNVKSKFKVDNNGFLYNDRLESEMVKRKSWTDSRKSNGKKGGRPKKHMDSHMGDGNEIEVVIEFKDEEERKVVGEYFDYRKEMKKPIKIKRSIKAIVKRLRELSGGDLSLMKKIINQTIERSWTGVFELDKGSTRKRFGRQEVSRDTIIDNAKKTEELIQNETE